MLIYRYANMSIRFCLSLCFYVDMQLGCYAILFHSSFRSKYSFMSLCGYVYMFTCLYIAPLPLFNVLNLYSQVFECISLVIYVDMSLCVYVVC